MNKEKFSDLSRMCQEETLKLIRRINEIIEERLKVVAVEFGVKPQDITLQIRPVNAYKTKYEVLVKIDDFTIETGYTVINKDLE